jgi:hypothetical protein
MDITHDEMLEILRKRAEAHAAACADLEDDPLIRAAFAPRKPMEPIKHAPPPAPYGLSFLLRRQAE